MKRYIIKMKSEAASLQRKVDNTILKSNRPSLHTDKFTCQLRE